MMQKFSSTQWKWTGLSLLATALFLYASGPYRFGVFDQTLSIPYLKQFGDPSLYPYDLAVAQKKYLGTFFWQALGWVWKVFPNRLPHLFFTLQAIAVFTFYYAGIRLVRKLGASVFGSILFVFITLMAHPVLGGIKTLDSILLTRSIAFSIALMSFTWTLDKKHVWASIGFGLSFIIHPLSSIALFALSVMLVLRETRRTDYLNLLRLLIPFLLIASPLLFQHINQHTESIAFTEWFDLMTLRSQHHTQPKTWGFEQLLQFFLTTSVGLLSVAFLPSSKIQWVHKNGVLLFFSIALIATLVLSYFPNSLVLIYQPVRASKELFLFCFIAFSAFVGSLNSKTPLFVLVLAVLMSLALLCNINELFDPEARLVIPACLTLYFISLKTSIPNWLMYAGCFIGVGILVRPSFEHWAPISIHYEDRFGWNGIATWAKTHSAKDALFILPPNHEGFRAQSERAVYVTWKEGTSQYFNPSFGPYWLNRLQMLGFKNEAEIEHHYHMLSLHAFETIKKHESQHSEVYILRDKNYRLNLPEKTDEGKWVLYQLK